jgi:hypothetical protein
MSDIERPRGDTYADVVLIKSKKTGLPINITGYSFLLTVDPNKAPTDASTKLFQLTGTIIDAPNGQVSFAPDVTQADHVGSYYYDVQMVDSAGKKRTILSGKYKFTQDITKD